MSESLDILEGPVEGSGGLEEAPVGVVGSPSTTQNVTVDILASAMNTPLQGRLVYLQQPTDDGKSLIAIGTITEITTVNHWHEDPNMRGVVKFHGSIPNLSSVADTRNADLFVQAAYLAEDIDPYKGKPPKENSGSLSMSPTTGTYVYPVTDSFLCALLRDKTREFTYLGRIYRSDVHLPLYIRHFGPKEHGGSGEAYHTGVFGMSGSGKSGLASYIVAAQLRHEEMAVLVIDPQGQFTHERGLPFGLQQWARRCGRPVNKFSIAHDLQLSKNAPLFCEMLSLTRFFKDMLTIKRPENRYAAIEEFVHVLTHQIQNWPDLSAGDLLRQILTKLVNDQNALQRIFSSQVPQARLQRVMNAILTDQQEIDLALKSFAPIHSLFTNKNPSGGVRTPISSVLKSALAPVVGKRQRAFTIIDFSGEGYAENLLEKKEIKANVLRYVCRDLNKEAEKAYVQGGGLNLLVVFDEAHRFAAAHRESDGEDMVRLAVDLEDYVRTTRKYGLGWMFITQDLSSLRSGIFDQLRVRAFGYGLAAGSNRHKLEQVVGDPSAVKLYMTFADPEAARDSEYAFMLTGPVSPLSFTGAPVFMTVYTDFEGEFCGRNGAF